MSKSMGWSRSFDSFWLSFADKVTMLSLYQQKTLSAEDYQNILSTGISNFVFLIVKIVLLKLALSLSATFEAKTQCFLH